MDSLNNGLVYTVDDIKEILSPVFDGLGIKSAILFGSYAKGTATEESDVDLLVDSGRNGLSFFGLFDPIMEALKKEVDIFDIIEIKSGSGIENEIKQTGRKIYG